MRCVYKFSSKNCNELEHLLCFIMVNDVVKCPHCGFEGEFKLIKTWKYSWWNVYFYECSKCSAHFASYVDSETREKVL